MRQCTAGEQVKHGHADPACGKRIGEFVERDARDRHIRAEAVQGQDPQGEEDLVAKILHLKGINDGL